MAVRWYLAHPLSATSVMVFLAKRDIDVSTRTVLRWVQTFGPLLAAEVRKHRRRPSRRWWVDEVFFFRKKAQEKRYLYRAINEEGQVIDVLFRDHRDTESAMAFFRRTLRHTGTGPATLISDYHQPYIQAVQDVFPEATHVRTGLHRAQGETTKPIERSHVPTRDRLRSTRGIKTLETGQRFFEGFEAEQALRHDRITWHALVRGYQHADASPHEHARAVVAALHTLRTRLARMPRAA